MCFLNDRIFLSSKRVLLFFVSTITVLTFIYIYIYIRIHKLIVDDDDDVGHAAKTVSQHGVWSSMIVEEFFLQGDMERAAGMDISPFMDRLSENSAKVRCVCFIGFVGYTSFIRDSRFISVLLYIVACTMGLNG